MDRFGLEGLADIVPDELPRSTPVSDTELTWIGTFESLVALEFPRIRRLALHFGLGGSEADDAAQEVFAKAWANYGKFRGGSKISTWLTRIALNEFSTRLRKQRRWSRVAERLLRSPAPPPRSASRAMEAGEAYAIASECVGRLPEKQREAFVLRYVEELSYAQAAEILGVTEGAVRVRAFQARKNLREMLKEYEL